MLEHILKAIEAGDYDQAINSCIVLEQGIEERLGFGEQCLTQLQAKVDFYGLFMVTLLLCKDLNEAKYLWKRAPTAVKSSEGMSKLAAVWAVGKSIWVHDIRTAVERIDSSEWPPVLRELLLKLRGQLIRDHCALLSRTITPLTAEAVAESLHISAEEAQQVMNNNNTTTITAATIVSPNRSNAARLHKDVEEMKRIAVMLAFCEQKPLKVDLSSKPASSTTSSAHHIREQQQQQFSYEAK